MGRAIPGPLRRQLRAAAAGPQALARGARARCREAEAQGRQHRRAVRRRLHGRSRVPSFLGSGRSARRDGVDPPRGHARSLVPALCAVELRGPVDRGGEVPHLARLRRRDAQASKAQGRDRARRRLFPPLPRPHGPQYPEPPRDGEEHRRQEPERIPALLPLRYLRVRPEGAESAARARRRRALGARQRLPGRRARPGRLAAGMRPDRRRPRQGRRRQRRAPLGPAHARRGVIRRRAERGGATVKTIELRGAGTLALSLLLSAPAALAQTAASYPSRPITLIVPYTPGSGIDILARAIAPKLNQKWGHPVVVDNKPGASGIIGADAVAKAAPNGYTLMVTVNSFTMAPPLYKNMPYDPIADFAPIAKIAIASYAFAVNPAVVPARDLSEFLATVKAKPGELNYGSPGNGTPHHLAMELMKLRLGLQIVHVPYKGLSGAMTDLLGGQVQMMFAPVHALLPNARAGKLKFLAVTGPRRSPFAPDAPTFRERGFDFMDDIDAWYAVMGPARLPRDVVAKVNAELRAIMFSADVREQLTNQGLVPVASTPEELAALIKADLLRWAKVVAEAKISAD